MENTQAEKKNAQKENISEKICPYCDEKGLKVWDQNPLSTTYMCPHCGRGPFDKDTWVGKTVKVLGPTLGIGASIFPLLFRPKPKKHWWE